MTNHCLKLLKLLVLAFLSLAGGGPLPAQQAPANQGQRPVRYYETSWGFEDLDIGALAGRLQRIGISLPVTLSGNVSGTLGVGIPWNSLGDGKAYRFNGVLKSPRLTVEGVELREVLLDLRYRDGVLSLQKIQVGQVGNRQEAETNEVLVGKASTELIPLGVLKLDTKLTGFQLSVLSPWIKSLPGIQGMLSGSLSGEVPVKKLRDAKAWKLTALVELDPFPPLGDESPSLPKFEVDLPLALESGVLSASGFVASVGKTEASGDGNLSLEGDLPWSVNAKVASQDLAELLATVNAMIPTAALAQASQQLTAERAAATVVAQGNLAKLSSSLVTGHAELGKIAWALSAPTTPQATSRPLSIDTIEFDYVFDKDSITLSKGWVTAAELRMQSNGEPSRFDLRVQLLQPYAFMAKVELPCLEIADFANIPQLAGTLRDAEGQVALKTDLRGTLVPLQIQGAGDLRASAVKYAELMLDELQTQFEIDENNFAFSQVEMQLYGGTAQGAITLPLTASNTGNARLTWHAIDLGTLVKKLAEVPTKLSGRSNGQIDLTIPAASLHEPQRWDYTAQLQVPALESNGVSVAAVSANAGQRDGKLTYSAVGKLFSGELNLQGTRTSSAASNDSLPSLGSWELSLQEASLSDFNRAFVDQPGQRIPVTGSLSLAVKYLTRTNSESIAEGVDWGGTATLSAVNVRGKQLTSGLQLAITGDARTARVESLTGDLAGGQLTADGSWKWAPVGNGRFRFRLRDVPLEKLAALTGEKDFPLSGPVDAELRIVSGDQWRIDGKLVLPAAKLAGITIRNARIPIRAFVHPTSGRVRADIGGSRFSVAGGRVAGHLSANRTRRWRLDGKFKFYRINAAQLSESNYGQGTLSGTLGLKGRNIRSVKDLSGIVIADLEQTQVAEIPLVSRFRNFVPGMPSGATRFNQGRLEARLSRGVIRLDELSLASSQLQIFAEGKITLAGRLDLEVAVSTGDRTDIAQARALLARFALATVAPVTLLVTANDFLSNRVVYLAIGGTTSRPSIRLLPGKILREEAIRFFLRQATGAVLPVAGAATATGAGSSR